MLAPCWQLLVEVEVKARPDSGLWTKVVDFLEGPRKLKLEVMSGSWALAVGQNCGADGDPVKTTTSAAYLLSGASVGALIGKLGGSTADGAMPAPSPIAIASPISMQPALFSVGSYCAVVLSDQAKGALFLTCNDVPTQFGAHDGALTVRISEAH